MLEQWFQAVAAQAEADAENMKESAGKYAERFVKDSWDTAAICEQQLQ